VLPPPKKTPEQDQYEKQTLRDGFHSQFWVVLRDVLQREMTARYRLVPTIDTIEHLKRTQGEILMLEWVLGLEAPFKSPRGKE